MTCDVFLNSKGTLNNDESMVLLNYANGFDEFDICKDMNLSNSELKTIELDIRAKLGAKTKPHMISKGFQFGLLMNRTLCFLLVLISSFQALDDNFLRVRNQTRNIKNPTSIVRIRQSGRNKEI